MAVQDELEAILARLQRMREELRIDLASIVTDEERDGIAASAPDTIGAPSRERHREA